MIPPVSAKATAQCHLPANAEEHGAKEDEAHDGQEVGEQRGGQKWCAGGGEGREGDAQLGTVFAMCRLRLQLLRRTAGPAVAHRPVAEALAAPIALEWAWTVANGTSFVAFQANSLDALKVAGGTCVLLEHALGLDSGSVVGHQLIRA